MRQTIQFAVLIFCLLLAMTGRADDSVAALGAGGIEVLRSDNIVMEEQDLVLSSRKVRTRFLFRNESAGDITTLVTFVMPDILPDDLFKRDDIALLRQLDFSVAVNGRRIQPMADIQAMQDERNVTKRLQQLGVRLDADQSFYAFIPTTLTQMQRAELKAEGLLHEHFPELPGWTTRLRLYWEQTFPAGAQVDIYQEYVPFLGTDNLSPATLSVPEFAAAVCLDGKRRQQASALLEKPGSEAHNLDYVLSTGSNWKGPIRALAITIEKQHESDVVATCLPGLKPQGKMAYSVLMKNAKPTQDIHVLFIEKGPAKPAEQ